MLLGVIQDQEQLWRETTEDDLSSVVCGGQIATYINPALYHDIQAILSRLVAKENQLIDIVTTNLAESWMHLERHLMVEKFSTGHKVGHSNTTVWGLGYSKILARIGAPVLGRK